MERRRLLRALVPRRSCSILCAQHVAGRGRDLFAEVCEQDLEGIVAKQLNSPYLPGKRTDCWLKIKRQERYTCAVIGFVPAETARPDFSALVIAAQIGEKLHCVGRVGTGFDASLRDRINDYLWSHLREEPVIPCREKARWVEPGLYCTIRCMERTRGGQLRAPVFGELYGDCLTQRAEA